MDGSVRFRLRATAAAVLALIGVALGATACAAPPPAACPPEVQRRQPAAALVGVTGADPFADVGSLIAAWFWSDPANCPPDEPEGPPAVVPEAPLAVLLPGAAVLTAGLGLLWSRRRRALHAP